MNRITMEGVCERNNEMLNNIENCEINENFNRI